jgi:hypothetical protein
MFVRWDMPRHGTNSTCASPTNRESMRVQFVVLTAGYERWSINIGHLAYRRSGQMALASESAATHDGYGGSSCPSRCAGLEADMQGQT